jgi:hypothetical protein
MPSARQRPADATGRDQHGRPASNGRPVSSANGHRGPSPEVGNPVPEVGSLVPEVGNLMPEVEQTAEPIDLGRLAWSVTTIGFAIGALVLLMQGYYGYASVTFAVAVAAGINLL